MPRGVVDLAGLKSPEAEALRRLAPPAGLPFKAQKLGHVVLRVKDLQRSVAFYTQVLGFRVSNVYPDTMMKGGMVFLRCNADHHCLALVGGMKEDASAKELYHLELFWGLDQVGSDNRSRPPDEWREEHSLENAIRNAPPGQDTTLASR